MKALVLDGSKTEKSVVNAVSEHSADFLRGNGYEVDTMVLRNEKIASCLGCFGC